METGVTEKVLFTTCCVAALKPVPLLTTSQHVMGWKVFAASKFSE